MGESTNSRATLRFDRRIRQKGVELHRYSWSFTAILLPSPRTLGCWPVASWMMHWD